MTTISFYAQSLPKAPSGDYPDATTTFSLIDRVKPRIEKVIIYFSSLHFGVDINGKKYLHLNDQDVNTLKPFLSQLNNFICHYSSTQLEFRFMLGGAGGAYQALFSDFEAYYGLLRDFFLNNKFISGVDLDVEESLSNSSQDSLQKIRKLIKRIHTDTHGFMERSRGFNITLAPVASSLANNGPGMGGFCYKDLLGTEEGEMISGLNVQVYGCFNKDTFRTMFNNNYPPKLITIGMLGDEYTSVTEFLTAMSIVEDMPKIFKSVQGFILWESGDTAIDPYQWTRAVLRAIDSSRNPPQKGLYTSLISLFGK